MQGQFSFFLELFVRPNKSRQFLVHTLVDTYAHSCIRFLSFSNTQRALGKQQFLIEFHENSHTAMAMSLDPIQTTSFFLSLHCFTPNEQDKTVLLYTRIKTTHTLMDSFHGLFSSFFFFSILPTTKSLADFRHTLTYLLPYLYFYSDVLHVWNTFELTRERGRTPLVRNKTSGKTAM